MPYTAVSYLALPRLHPELAAASPRPLPEGTLFLWPGLPRPPQSGVFAPDYPWTPDQAAACLADFERAGREGVRGAPVAAFSALGALGAGDDLSPEERRALSELMGELSSASDRAVDANDETGRQAAQRTLLLAWLQEKQVLELRELEQRVRRGQSALAGLLGEGVVPEADFVGVASGGASLPPWRSVLAAASAFLPRSVAGSDDTAVLALESGHGRDSGRSRVRSGGGNKRKCLDGGGTSARRLFRRPHPPGPGAGSGVDRAGIDAGRLFCLSLRLVVTRSPHDHGTLPRRRVPRRRFA